MPRLGSWLLLLLLLVLPRPLLGQNFEDVVGQGLKLYEEGNFDGAIEKFFAAKLLRDEPDLIYNVARSYDKKGDCAAASKYYEQFLSRPDAATELRSKARRYLTDLGVCQSKGTLALVCYPEKALVTLDGYQMGICGEYQIEEGEYLLTISAEGFKPQQRQLLIVANRSEAATIQLQYIEPDSGLGGGSELPNWPAVALIAGGSALVATSLLLDVVNYAGNASELSEYALGDPRRRDLEDSYDSYRTATWVTGGLGLGVLAAGIVWYALEPSWFSSAGLEVAPMLAKDGAGAHLRLRF